MVLDGDGSNLEVQLLGGAELRFAGEPLDLPKSRKTLALLAHLILCERPIRRDRLCAILWETADDPRAALRWSLSKLRPIANAGGQERLRTRGQDVSFDRSRCVIDWFELRAAAARNFAGESSDKLAYWADNIENGLLAGYDLPDCPEYQSWLIAVRHEAESLLPTLQRLVGRGSPSRLLPERPAVAVLPFDNMSSNPDDEYFADGLTEDLITALSLWKSFPVIARNSSFTYKGKRVRVEQVGAELGARYVLEGSVRRAGDQIRIHAKLLDAESGHNLWAEKFTRGIDDVFRIQDEITTRVAGAVAPQVHHAEWSRVVAKRTSDLTAWDFYIRGMELFHREDAKTNGHAREMFASATEHDPDYVDAWAHLAWTHVRDVDLRRTDDRVRSIAAALELARHAIDLDSTSSVAHLVLGTAQIWNEELELGLASAERAVDLNPNFALAAMAVGNRLDLVGKAEEGVARMEASLRLNARDPHRWHYMGFLSRAYAARGEHEVALDWANRGLTVRPSEADLHFRAALCLANLDRVDEAAEALRECERLEPGLCQSRASWAPYQDAARNQKLFDGVHRHGLLVP
ncbi:MAG: tetratricopeptide repeat protein [Myxococcales bacterium]|nr:MAG: tetratricopeptide repeat protein [Myxococcales bacterium]